MLFKVVAVLALLAVGQVSAFLKPSFSRRASAFTGLRMSQLREDLRNVAIIAHVDHGKTTLVDSMIRQSGAFRANQEVDSMDSDAQERERGITILAKNAAIMVGETKINLVDTPGHADFGGEVERIMNMVDGVLLVVDSVDGPKPQTRFVLKKALEKGIKAIVVVNKIDRPNARPEYVVDKVFDLFAELDANDEQMDFQIVYASGINGISGLEPDALTEDLQPLFGEILKIPPAKVDPEHPLQLLIANVDYDEFKGKLGIGRVTNGELKAGSQILYGVPGEEPKKGKVNEVFIYNNVGKEKVSKVESGDICMITGIEDIMIGETVMDLEDPKPLPPIAVEEPTVRMSISVNKSPLAGREGKLLQSRAIRDRLYKELDTNVALKVYETESADTYEICGRGQLHLTVLIENMRREGFEVMIGPPTVIEKEIDGAKCEPYDRVDVTVPDEFSSSCVDILNKRKGEMQAMGPAEGAEGMTALQFVVPTRGMIGVRSALLTATKGTVVLDTVFDSYKPTAGQIQQREKGSLLAFENGVANPYGINGAQDRGRMFIEPKTDVYKDMIIGVHQRPGDLPVNVCKTKALTNMRASGSDDLVKIVPPMELNLDIAVEYIQDDELVEVTPKNIRMCKHPDHLKWAKARKGKK
jgi:GTP-binding protein